MSMTSLKNANISHYLGVDFGKAKIGLAVADSETRIAFSYGVLKNDKDLMKNIRDIVKKENISKIVIGNQMEIRSPFGDRISKALNVPIEFQNELFSTQQAERNLKEKGAKRIKRFDDQEAARIILQSWLDRSRNT
ncbi:MAG: Holliday junction resolvase RuvX [Candidatus Moranbacteria bacterium]|nr:Holliday junction resolvase RuvX [Candidatus Moranbacteria bacterium]